MASAAQPFDALAVALAEVRRLRSEAKARARAARAVHVKARSEATLESLALFKEREDPTKVHRRCECGALLTTWILRPVRAGGTGGEMIRCDNGHDCSARFVVVNPKQKKGGW